MRVLEERNNYIIWYSPFKLGVADGTGYPKPCIQGLIMDRNTNKYCEMFEHWKGNDEKCLVKLRKNLINAWEQGKCQITLEKIK